MLCSTKGDFMKKILLNSFAITTLFYWAANLAAQENFDQDLNSELNKLYDVNSNSNLNQNSNINQLPQVQVNVQSAAPRTMTSQPQIQKQPVTYVEATPLSDSKSDRIRKSRQDAEMQTEQSIVEKLEQSRLEDEKRRAEVLFGDRFGHLLNNENQSAGTSNAKPVNEEKPNPPQVQIIQVPVAPQPADIKPIDKDLIREEVNTALSQAKQQDLEDEVVAKNTVYFGILGGLGEYPDARNVKGQYAVGFLAGSKYNDKLVFEGSFLYSKYDIQQRQLLIFSNGFVPRVTEMDQYNLGALVKYQILDGLLRPAFGGVASYTYRTFTDTQFASANSNSANSNAVDFGVMLGADLEFNKDFSIGLDFRYMWNLTSRTSSDFNNQNFQRITFGNESPIERLSYYTIGLSARAQF
jgi:hypothetical protein